MPRIQRPRNARIRAVTEPRPRIRSSWGSSGMRVDGLGMRSGWGPRTIPAPPPSAPPSPSPAPARQPAFDPMGDPDYKELSIGLNANLGAARTLRDTTKHGLYEHYGLGPAVNPLTGVQFDYSQNPNSLAAQLQRSHERGVRGASNALAARGLRRSGAMDRQVSERGQELVFQRANLQQQLLDRIREQDAIYSAAERDVMDRLVRAKAEARQRYIDNAPPATAAPKSKSGSSQQKQQQQRQRAIIAAHTEPPPKKKAQGKASQRSKRKRRK